MLRSDLSGLNISIRVSDSKLLVKVKLKLSKINDSCAGNDLGVSIPGYVIFGHI